ncbi:hypothetical protein [Listeria innocua]|uniref:hypothetical protein n=1 Tax=Listeria innocua TaxID=1642 RepID=UPI000FB61144|nr:hypothetical protein [Listeria innocua]EAC4303150.1 hypothetical protein [Listeria monocytogenes]EAC5890895.1 hypothetical protein [Listeria monocytogenes]EAD5196254.1 hypothetical protein [Listeria monocytogenes]EAD8264410.1 hypothetical protein [Listeria monocytogenes]EAD8801501.1 hypothetical protein [Listeria monocytogenes]
MAQKNIVVENGVKVYADKTYKKVVTELPRNAIFKYESGGYCLFKTIKGYTNRAHWTCPAISGSYVIALAKVTQKLAESVGGKGVIKITRGEIVRIDPSSLKAGYVNCAVFNDTWEWGFKIKLADVKRCETLTYNSIAKL